jgi:AcrR family transcriptional regulator
MTRRTATTVLDPTPPAPAEDRQSRRKRETRAKLLSAAERVMAQKGIEATTIQEITDAADVGFGSFYNHFESKEAIVEAIMREWIDPLAIALDRLALELEDPAEVVAGSVRHTVRKGATDEVWGRFLFFSGIDVPYPQIVLLQRLRRDVKAGVKAGRFEVADVDAAATMIAGGVLAITRSMRERHLGADGPERAAAFALSILGLPQKEARKIASRPLPAVKLPR